MTTINKPHNQEIIFVCSAVSSSGELCCQMFYALNAQEANKLFVQQFNVIAQSILGPFVKKHISNIDSNTPIQLLGTAYQKAEYNGWLVHAFALKDNPDYAYLLFIKRLSDNKKISPPKGKIIIPFIDLRFIE